MASSFTVSAKPDTDVWKKPPSHDVFTAPYKPHPSGAKPLNTFTSATISFTSTYTHQFDQAGLLLILTKPSSPSTPRKWIKTGIEFFDGVPRLSTVCCDRWADWSVGFLPTSVSAEDVQAGKQSIGVRVEKEVGELGDCLWVHALLGDGGKVKVPLREIAWVFGEDRGEGWQLEVCAAVARPSKEPEGELEAKFDGFEVRWDEK